METASGRAGPSFCHSPQLHSFPSSHSSPPANQPQRGLPVSGEAAIMLKAPADVPPGATKSLDLLEPLVVEKKEYACKRRLLILSTAVALPALGVVHS